MVKWKNAAEKPAPWLRVFLCGPTGGGKTLIASSFPEPAFIVPANEDSIETLRGYDIPYVEVGADHKTPVRGEVNQILDAMMLAAKQDTFHERYGKTIVFESLSHYQDLVINEIQAQNPKGGMQVWGHFRAHMLHLRDQLWRLPAHIVLTSLDRTRTDNEGRVIDLGPLLSGQSGQLIPSSCHVMAYCEQKASTPPRWVTHVAAYKGFPGRSRLRGFSNGTYENFSFETLLSYVPNLSQ